MKQLRWYQKDCVAALWDHIRERDDNPVAVLPTGAGKSLVLTQLARDVVAWGGRAMLLSHVRELVQQVADHIQAEDPTLPLGIYSAGLGVKETGYQVTVAGIQSAFRNPEAFGKLDVVMVDEAHRIPPEGEGMYRTFLAAHPNARLIGVTATPYRTGSGMLCTKDGLLNHVAYEVGVRELIVQGYLSRLVSKAARSGKIDASNFHIRGGEYVQEEVDQATLDEERVALACLELAEKTADRSSVLVFSSSVAHGEMIGAALGAFTDKPIGMIFGDTDGEQRAETIYLFKQGKIKYLVNCAVLTEGFDAPNVDTVVLLRPTASPGLYYQMVGRGFRLHPGKADCLVLDFGGNILRHGPIDSVQPSGRKGGGGGSAPAKECPRCQSVIAAGYGKCPDCGFEFPARGSSHDVKPGEASILSEPVTIDVDGVAYHIHTKKDSPTPTLRVEYMEGGNLGGSVSEWVCFEHHGYARHRAELWWAARSDRPVPATVAEAYEIATGVGIGEPEKVTFTQDGKYRRIIGYDKLEKRANKEVPF